MMRVGEGRAFFNSSLFRLSVVLPLLAIAAIGAAAATVSATYTYDPVGRLTTALYDNGTCVAYGYDAAGNRTLQTNTIGGAPVSPTWGSGVWGCFPWTSQ